MQYNFKPDGGLNAKGCDVRGANTWSLIRCTNAGEFREEMDRIDRMSRQYGILSILSISSRNFLPQK